ncbi:hypothetical protein NPIRD3C_0987 [Nitrosopumilus piranensis]|uniref:Uncharacterized protein n=1 Tax=Nitrosopumilus piranensis TaxID=1582439 RepID=A0A0C5BVE5_9ARCH|nr:hypothetical protein NPIRD3C_0987 [Nitrosopumilus piranensis]
MINGDALYSNTPIVVVVPAREPKSEGFVWLVLSHVRCTIGGVVIASTFIINGAIIKIAVKVIISFVVFLVIEI